MAKTREALHAVARKILKKMMGKIYRKLIKVEVEKKLF